MEASVRRNLPALIEELVAHAPGYDFCRALRLAEEAFPPPRSPGRLPREIRLRPAAELSFPAADIRRCRVDAEGRIEFQLGFLGLYGVDAPVSHDLLEAAAGEEDGAAPLRAFLDIFSRRLYELLYLGWKKYRPVGARECPSLFEAYLDALSGMGDGVEERLFAGHFGGRVRSAEALCGLLSEFLEAPVQVLPFRPRWIRVTGRPPLGGGAEPLALGENAMLGERVLDVTRRVEIRIGPLSPADAAELLPGGGRAAVLYRLVWRYLPPAVDFDLRLLVRSEGRGAPALGKEEIRLGWSSPLGGDRGGIREIPLSASSLRPTAGIFGREED